VRVAFAIAALTALGTGFQASSAEWHPRGPALRGDITGDGRPETAVIEYRGRPSCDFRLVVGPLVARVRPEICDGKPGELYSGPDPHVAVLAELDRRPGLEVVVQIAHGAYMEFADIWTYRGGALRRYAGREPHLSYGASVGTGAHVVGCSRRAGVVLISDRSYPPQGRIVRRWYRAEDLRLKLIRTKTIAWNSEQAPPFPEFREPQPLATCAKARAPR
jgi:hypothetical protein